MILMPKTAQLGAEPASEPRQSGFRSRAPLLPPSALIRVWGRTVELENQALVLALTPRSCLVTGNRHLIATCLRLHIPTMAHQPAPEFFKDQMKSLAGKPFGGKTI